jgi:hypothetical protein
VGLGSKSTAEAPGPTDLEFYAADNASQAPAADRGGATQDLLAGQASPSVDGRGLLILGSAVALVTGIALLLIRRLARRPI